jgi:hypothetical protein
MPIERILAEAFSYSCSDDEAIEILMRARVMVKDWGQRSVINRSITRGTLYNIITDDIVSGGSYSVSAEKRSIIWEFGEYMLDYEKRVSEISKGKPSHEEPNNLDLSQFIKKLPRIERIR